MCCFGLQVLFSGCLVWLLGCYFCFGFVCVGLLIWWFGLVLVWVTVLVWLVVGILYGWDLVVFALVFWGLVALLRAGLAGVWDCLRVGLVDCVCGFWWVCYGSGLGLL